MFIISIFIVAIICDSKEYEYYIFSSLYEETISLLIRIQNQRFQKCVLTVCDPESWFTLIHMHKIISMTSKEIASPVLNNM